VATKYCKINLNKRDNIAHCYQPYAGTNYRNLLTSYQFSLSVGVLMYIVSSAKRSQLSTFVNKRPYSN